MIGYHTAGFGKIFQTFFQNLKQHVKRSDFGILRGAQLLDIIKDIFPIQTKADDIRPEGRKYLYKREVFHLGVVFQWIGRIVCGTDDLYIAALN